MRDQPGCAALGDRVADLLILRIPLAGNAAEHFSAIVAALHRRADLAFNIAIGSPSSRWCLCRVFVLAGLVLGQDMTLAFSHVEVATLNIAAVLAALTALYGRAHWLKGAQLTALYTILAISTFFIGNRNHSGVRLRLCAGSRPCWLQHRESRRAVMRTGRYVTRRRPAGR